MDVYDEKIPGGTGKTIKLKHIDKKIVPLDKTFIAGGITLENIKNIIKKFSPFGIDVASGVEIAPGIKDKEKMRKLVEVVKI